MTIAPNFAAFPKQIRHLIRYVVWRYVEETKTDGTKRQNKVPFIADGKLYDRRTAHGASSVDPSTWCSLETAIATYNQGGWDGVMFALHESGFIGVDTDHSRDAETGHIDPRSAEIIHRIDSYTEISVSGTGIHALVEGILPAGGRKFGTVEMYDSGRFLVMTGAHLAGTPTTIEPRQCELEQLHADVTVEYDVEKRLGKDAKFRALWEGDTASYESQSSADLALCSHLGRLCKGDVSQIDRMFRRSKLYRDKWERQDYRDRTIAKALEGGITFTPRTLSDDDVAELERLRAENEHLRTIIGKQQQEIQQVKARQRWQNDCF